MRTRVLLAADTDAEAPRLLVNWQDITNLTWGRGACSFATLAWQDASPEALVASIQQAMGPGATGRVVVFCEGDSCATMLRALGALHHAGDAHRRVHTVILDSPARMERTLERASAATTRRAGRTVVLMGDRDHTVAHPVAQRRRDRSFERMHRVVSPIFRVPPAAQPARRHQSGALVLHTMRHGTSATLVCVERAPRLVVRWLDEQRQLKKLPPRVGRVLAEHLMDEPTRPYEPPPLNALVLAVCLLLTVVVVVATAARRRAAAA